MEELQNLLITTGIGLVILGASYLLDLVVGSIKVIFTKNLKWSWRKMFEDLLKALLIAGSIEMWVVLWYVAGWYASNAGLEIKKFTDAMSISGMIGAIGVGSFWYLSNAGQNLLQFVNTKHIEVKVDEDKADYAAVAGKVKELLAGVFVQQDDGKNIEVVKPEVGATCYYGVDVSTPTAFYNAVNRVGFDEGWGYQCVAGFKEFQFSLSGFYVAAGGAAKNYADKHDEVESLGFEWHDGNSGFQDGDWAIWTDGEYGHVAMYYQGKWFGQNQGATNGRVGTPFNLMSLPTNGIAGFYRPNIYKVEPAPEPEPVPTQEPASDDDRGFFVGEKVVPVRLVDYNGTPLKQYDDYYTISQIDGNRAVLTALRNGEFVVWAAMNTNDIRRVKWIS